MRGYSSRRPFPLKMSMAASVEAAGTMCQGPGYRLSNIARAREASVDNWLLALASSIRRNRWSVARQARTPTTTIPRAATTVIVAATLVAIPHRLMKSRRDNYPESKKRTRRRAGCVLSRWRRGGTAPRSMPPIDQRVYVRSSLLEVSSRWPVSNLLLDEPSKASPSAGRRGGQLARICDTTISAPGGLPQRQGAQPKLRSQSQVVVGFCEFPECFTRNPRTWARNTDLTTHVEPSSPPTCQNVTPAWV